VTTGTFSTRLNEVMRSRGLTKQATAELCKVNYHTLNAVLTRESAIPNAQIALQISDGLGVPYEWLVAGRGSRRHPIGIQGIVTAHGRVDAVRSGVPRAIRVDLPTRLTGAVLEAVIVEGEVLEPVFRDGDALFFEATETAQSPQQVDSRPYLIRDSLGASWIRFVQPSNRAGIIKAVELSAVAAEARETTFQWIAPILLCIPSAFLDLIE
jgi:transcriptional regulator with XRE-family HTH domain